MVGGGGRLFTQRIYIEKSFTYINQVELVLPVDHEVFVCVINCVWGREGVGTKHNACSMELIQKRIVAVSSESIHSFSYS